MARSPLEQLGPINRFTFELPVKDRQQLNRLAESQGITTGECLRRIIAEKFAQLREEQS